MSKNHSINDRDHKMNQPWQTLGQIRECPGAMTREYKAIPLTQGYEAIVSAEDYDEIAKHKWKVDKRSGRRAIYARRRSGNGYIAMHQQVAGAKWVDHVDGDGLNNSRENLRPTTPQLNSANRRKLTRPCTSRFKGVSWFKNDRCWNAKIVVDGKRIHLGSYDDEAAAAYAYDRAAIMYFGEHALPNGVPPVVVPFGGRRLTRSIKLKVQGVRADLEQALANLRIAPAVPAAAEALKHIERALNRIGDGSREDGNG